MNIFDMPFRAVGPFPTNSVENGGGRAEKIGKSYPDKVRLAGEWRRAIQEERSPALAVKGTSVRNEMREVREKLGEVRGEK